MKGASVVDDDSATAEPTDTPDAPDGGNGNKADGGAVVTPPQPAAERRVSLRLRTLVTGVVMAVLTAALAAMTWLFFDERSTAAAQVRLAEDHRHAEQIALDYAVGAAEMNFQDLNAWKTRLVQGTSPELEGKLTKAADSMQQLLIPLEWNSTSEALVAKVRSEDGGVYVVDTFVSVLTRTTQAPENLQSTATYSITIDSNNDWQITDVGGIGAVAGAK